MLIFESAVEAHYIPGKKKMGIQKKPTWLDTRKVFNHVGLLRNWPPGEPGRLLFSRPTTCIHSSCETDSSLRTLGGRLSNSNDQYGTVGRKLENTPPVRWIGRFPPLIFFS